MNSLGLRRSFFLTSLFIATSLYGRPGVDWRGNPGWEPEGAYCRLYDKNTVVTLKGSVEKVEKVVPMKGMGNGVHFILVAPTEKIPVQLGPVWYVEKQSVQIKANDLVEVTGSRVTCDGKKVILAAEIRRGAETLSLRDAAGKPVWSVWQADSAPKE